MNNILQTNNENKISVIVSRFNREITEKLLEGTLQRFDELGVQSDRIEIAYVPGAVELPLIAQQYAKTGCYQAIVCLGAVIRGETSHYDYVCQQVSWGCQQVALRHNVPVIFGVLTTEDRFQALARVGGDHGHKGCDAAEAAIEMIKLMQQLRGRVCQEITEISEGI